MDSFVLFSSDSKLVNVILLFYFINCTEWTIYFIKCSLGFFFVLSQVACCDIELQSMFASFFPDFQADSTIFFSYLTGHFERKLTVYFETFIPELFILTEFREFFVLLQWLKNPGCCRYIGYTFPFCCS